MSENVIVKRSIGEVLTSLASNQLMKACSHPVVIAWLSARHLHVIYATHGHKTY